jgi:hypothetical protein
VYYRDDLIVVSFLLVLGSDCRCTEQRGTK